MNPTLPTARIAANKRHTDNASKIGYAPASKITSRAFILRNLETTRRAHNAGVKIAVGSDAIYTMFALFTPPNEDTPASSPASSKPA
jgi:hypothetical protein